MDALKRKIVLPKVDRALKREVNMKAELEALSVVICHVQVYKINSNYHIRKMRLLEWKVFLTTLCSTLPCVLLTLCLSLIKSIHDTPHPSA